MMRLLPGLRGFDPDAIRPACPRHAGSIRHPLSPIDCFKILPMQRAAS
ncbi:hypothetical protein SXCC_04087 [Gluconacetobacter sp. SXCC-1]|nr:hypothetical protein SXCC_04087 [Gluconacetobacter sp. SXCC-1]